ncbi:putative lipoprotein [Ruegeria lacuscaerulensis ITI-1157]|nr:putative lipoprotein [Ruegeria lacuscaerulensis ITI-1157]SHJ71262.1 hypothetical protein SAMN05444404_2469 [Ruegeria lacuscaerulensis ITI-1157]
MSARTGLKFVAILLAVGACTDTASMSGAPGDLAKVPEGVIAIADPGQNLNAVRIMPEDGCYWYRHVGPVETTYLPLRTVDGRPICARA